MTIRPFPIRTRPLQGESLWSFLIRLSSRNGISILGMLNSIRNWEKKYVQRADWGLLDFSPETAIDMQGLSQLSGLSVEVLHTMTVHNLLKTFGNKEEIQRARFLSGMLIDHYRFCPQCLSESVPYHRLLWRFENITGCLKHRCSLHNECPNCFQTISLKEIAELNACPYCGHRLSTANYQNGDIEWRQQKWLYDALDTVLKTNITHVSHSDTANRLLYILCGYGNNFDRQTAESALPNPSVLPTLLQHARETLRTNRALHLSFLLSVLLTHNVSMSEFLEMEVPQTFIDSLREEKVRKYDQFSCQAPWCSGDDRPGTLIKTGTTSKRLSTGQTLLYYMACTECGCEYAIDEHGSLTERTYFMEGYHVLSKISSPMTSIKKIARRMNLSEDKARRCVAYFRSRLVLSVSRDVPHIHLGILEKVITAVRNGQTIKQIQSWPDWVSYDEFLLYRFHKDVMKELIVLKRPRVSERKDRSDKRVKVEKALQLLLEADRDITIASVSELIGACPETIRNWGCNQLIADMKGRQKGMRLAKRNETIYRKAEEYLSHQNGQVRSDELYQHLGILKRVLWRSAPEITAYIAELLRTHNQLNSYE
ncbi:TniQ family protein [Alicyclobacillus tolerans]|uniref:TniQ family protein n=1 Tax=Alicyclobacillus tolerans TaxID=90970 RepID=UPI001F23EF22|nr:TniQ family protein [Alicyclobacillus tolerans]MCF8567089.1 TniQ family protein [Alicyclobacillus tolerans]